MAKIKQPKKKSKAQSKQTKAFKSTGKLAKQLEGRKRAKVLKEKIAARQFSKRPKKGNGFQTSKDGEEAEEERGGEEEEENQSISEDDADSIASSQDSVEDLESIELDEAGDHKMDLHALKSNDPEFYKFLQENDNELLNFDPDQEMDSSDAEESQTTQLTLKMLQEWSKSLIKTQSLKTLRKFLLALKCVVQADSSAQQLDEQPAYSVRDTEVFNKLVVNTLKYTPIVLSNYCPAKKQANGKFKIATQSKAYGTVQRLIKSYFTSLTKLVATLPNTTTDDGPNLQQLALIESAKLIPYVVGNRKVAKHYQALLLEQWSTGRDNVKLAAILGLRSLTLAADDSIAEVALKATYTTFISTCKRTTIHTLPAINLMKNSAAELFLLKPAMSYQLAYSYIRQLALHLRKSVKSQEKEAYQAVYNWQVVHAIDFWSLVLATACDPTRSDYDKTYALQPLIFPLVEVGLGALRLVSTSRFFPLHFQIIRSLLRIMQRTGTFIPLAPAMLAVLECQELKRKPKPSTQLKAFDFEYVIRAPTQYLKTKTYADAICEELAFILLEYLATLSLSVAFPEIVVPVTVTIKRHLKNVNKNPKLSACLKPLLEKVEANKEWVQERRAKIEFSPKDRSQLVSFLKDVDPATSPLGNHLRREKKQRDTRRALLEKAARQTTVEQDDEDEAIDE